MLIASQSKHFSENNNSSDKEMFRFNQKTFFSNQKGFVNDTQKSQFPFELHHKVNTIITTSNEKKSFASIRNPSQEEISFLGHLRNTVQSIWDWNFQFSSNSGKNIKNSRKKKTTESYSKRVLKTIVSSLALSNITKTAVVNIGSSFENWSDKGPSLGIGSMRTGICLLTTSYFPVSMNQLASSLCLMPNIVSGSSFQAFINLGTLLSTLSVGARAFAINETNTTPWCYNSGRPLVGDFNGDGKDDLLCNGLTGINQILVSNGNSFVAISSATDVYGTLNIGVNYQWCISPSKILIGDFNGDGKDDLWCNFNGVNYFMISTGNGFTPMESAIDSLGHIYVAYETDGWCTVPGISVVGDFNGDGKDDIWCDYSAGNAIMVSTGSAFLPISSATNAGGLVFLNSYTSWCGGLRSLDGDFNGDKKSDVLCAANGANYFMISTGSNFAPINSALGGYLSINGGSWCTDSQRFLIGDFSGDGKSDLWCNDGSSGLNEMMISSGSNFVSIRSSVLNGQLNIGLYINWCYGTSSTPLVGDFNDDGKIDLWCNTNGTNSFMASNGTAFSSLLINQPINQPSQQFSIRPSVQPTGEPSNQPTEQPSAYPSEQPSGCPTTQPVGQPSLQPSAQPSEQPTKQPIDNPSNQPTNTPSRQPNGTPTSKPTRQPIEDPSSQPSGYPIGQPTKQPTDKPSNQPTKNPSQQPSDEPTSKPSGQPNERPSSQPSGHPTGKPTKQPTNNPSNHPTGAPSRQPNDIPTSKPTRQPIEGPSSQPSGHPTGRPIKQPISKPSGQPNG